MDFSAAIAAAAEESPHGAGAGTVRRDYNLTLRVDGDGLAYYCAGNDETHPGEARYRLIEKIRQAAAAIEADHIEIVATARGSHKGYRYAIARRKPYQGQRKNSRRPKNWEYLRSLYDSNAIPGARIVQTKIAEADDLFSLASMSEEGGSPQATDRRANKQVIYTQDKDMRMVPGLHLGWTDNILITVPHGTWELVRNDKVYGRKWFWLQMLMGDTVDYIPGLPYYVTPTGKKAQVGEATATKLLAHCSNEADAQALVPALYESFYKKRWLVEMLEQAMLLWMRTDKLSLPFNVCAEGNPLHFLTTDPLYESAFWEINERIDIVNQFNAAQDHASG